MNNNNNNYYNNDNDNENGSKTVVEAEGHDLPVAAEQHRVSTTHRGLDVPRARRQGWDVALAAIIVAEGHGLPVVAEQHHVGHTTPHIDYVCFLTRRRFLT